jgi:hypothetical protein
MKSHYTNIDLNDKIAEKLRLSHVTRQVHSGRAMENLIK